MISKIQLKNQWDHTIIKSEMATKINVKHVLQWYIGFGENLNRSLMILCDGYFKKLPPSLSIDSECKRRDNGQWLYVLNLLEEEQKDVFLDMCTDLINYSAKGKDEQEAYILLSHRYEQWNNLLGKVRKELLSDEMQRGLFGELSFLYKKIKEYPKSVRSIVKGWNGPDNNHQDFLYNTIWYEIKTICKGKNSVHISSIEQLDTLSRGELVVFQLEKAPKENSKAQTLYKLVELIEFELDCDFEAKIIYKEKLIEAGYIQREEYDEKAYIIAKSLRYDVNQNFPALTKDNLPSSVLNASYELSLDALHAWQIDSKQ